MIDSLVIYINIYIWEIYYIYTYGTPKVRKNLEYEDKSREISEYEDKSRSEISEYEDKSRKRDIGIWGQVKTEIFQNMRTSQEEIFQNVRTSQEKQSSENKDQRRKISEYMDNTRYFKL